MSLCCVSDSPNGIHCEVESSTVQTTNAVVARIPTYFCTPGVRTEVDSVRGIVKYGAAFTFTDIVMSDFSVGSASQGWFVGGKTSE